MNQHLLKGDELFDNRLGVVTHVVLDTQLIKGCIKALDCEKKSDVYLDYEDLRNSIAAGAITPKRKGAPKVTTYQNLSDKELEDLAFATNITRRILEYVKTMGVSRHMAYQAIKREYEANPDSDKPFPSDVRIYRYLGRHDNGLPLLFDNSNRGNFVPRRSESVRAFIEDAAERFLLQPQSRWTMTNFAKWVNQALRDEQLIDRSDTVSQDYIRKVVRSITTDPETERMDPRLVAAAKSTASEVIRVETPLMRVEQDALHLPWRINTPDGLSNSIYLVHAIDCCTGMPVGWHLVVGSPSVSDSLKCVESVLFSKKERFKALDLDYELDCFGTPSLLVFDNGPETKGERMQKLTALGIDPKHCKSRHAHGKPFIERLNRSLKSALETLPGCTRFDGVDGQRKPEELKELPMELHELERWIVRWYHEEWANTELRRHLQSVFIDPVHLGNTPAQRWKTITQDQGHPLPLPPSISRWRMAIYEHDRRTLSRKTGITYEGFNFRGPNMSYLITKYGETTLDILVDPDDFRHIYVCDGPDGQLLELVNTSVDAATPAYSFTQAKEMMRGAAGRTPDAVEQSEGFRRDLYKRSTETAKSGKSTKKWPEQSRATTQRSKETSAVMRAIEKPMASPPATMDMSPTDATDINAADVPMLPVLDRNTRQSIL